MIRIPTKFPRYLAVRTYGERRVPSEAEGMFVFSCRPDVVQFWKNQIHVLDMLFSTLRMSGVFPHEVQYLPNTFGNFFEINDDVAFPNTDHHEKFQAFAVDWTVFTHIEDDFLLQTPKEGLKYEVFRFSDVRNAFFRIQTSSDLTATFPLRDVISCLEKWTLEVEEDQ